MVFKDSKKQNKSIQWQYYLDEQLIFENQRLHQLIQGYNQRFIFLERKINKLITENKMLREFLERSMHPLNIENFLNLSNDINLDKLRINSIQSGAAFNLGETISNTTNSDMDMKMGSNSMNSGDSNHMNSHGNKRSKDSSLKNGR